MVTATEQGSQEPLNEPSLLDPVARPLFQSVRPHRPDHRSLRPRTPLDFPSRGFFIVEASSCNEGTTERTLIERSCISDCTALALVVTPM